MAVTHPSSVRNLIVDTVVDLLESAGTTDSQMILMASGTTALVTLTMASTAFGSASTGVATANAITNGTVTVAGTATLGLLRTSTEQNTLCNFSVTSTGGGGDLELSSNVLSTGQTCSITSLTYTGPA